VAAKLYPDLFKDFDTVVAAKDFYKAIYGIDDATFTVTVEPKLTGDIH
jgi:hypothetical protein